MQYIAANSEGENTDGLFALVLSFQYDDATHQLNASVAYTNTGKHRRTILDATFFYRTPDQKPDTHYPLVDSEQDILRRVYDAPLYVEAGSEQIQNYKREVNPRLLERDGNIFGIWIVSLSRDSLRPNYTTIEAMRIEPMQGFNAKNENAIIHVRVGNAQKVSLDKMAGSHVIDHPMIFGASPIPTQPSQAADKATSPH